MSRSDPPCSEHPTADSALDESCLRGCELTRIGTARSAGKPATGKHAKPQRAREAVLSLGQIPIEIEWQANPQQDVLARLLLELIGEDSVKEIFDENHIEP